MRWPRCTGVKHATALLGYLLVSVAFTWPLPLNLSTHLTGAPTGDTGVYVWNQWVFYRELVSNGNLPYFTNAIFSLSDPANLSLHNYTTFQNLLALPLLGRLGIVTTFNVILLAMTILTAYAMFLLARHVTGRDAEAWLAGALLAWSPVLVTRSGGHFSLVAAAPLAIFALLLLTAQWGRLRDGLALGATLWWAASTDAYYGIYCLLLAVVYLGTRVVAIRRRPSAGNPTVVRTLNLLTVLAALLVAGVAATGGWQGTVFGVGLSVRSLNTPVLVLMLLAVARLSVLFEARLVPVDGASAWRVAQTAATGAVVAALMLAPRLYALGVRVARSGIEDAQVFWRSSPGGVDLLAYFLPNPNHPWAPDALRTWLTPRPDAYIENVASLTFVALAVIAIALAAGWRLPRFWLATAGVFGLCALGPFIHLAGMNTHIATPWALLRYVPLVGMARTPARFSIVLMLAVCVLFAIALAWLGTRWPHRRRAILATVGLALLFELLPAPRALYSASVPVFYDRVAAAPADTRVLELPFGVRDGTSSLGNFTARSQYFQTRHGKPLIGGYLSRVSERRRSLIRSDDMLDALMTLSAAGELSDARRRQLVAAGPAFVARARIGFIVVDAARTPAALRRFVAEAFGLVPQGSQDGLELYVPGRSDR